MKTLAWLPVLIVLSLPACVTQRARDDSPASDLTTLRANAERHLAPRTLDNGRLYCLEDAATEGAQDDCGADLEELVWLSERDKARGLRMIRAYITRASLERMKCRWYQVACHVRRRALQEELAATQATP